MMDGIFGINTSKYWREFYVLSVKFTVTLITITFKRIKKCQTFKNVDNMLQNKILAVDIRCICYDRITPLVCITHTQTIVLSHAIEMYIHSK